MYLLCSKSCRETLYIAPRTGMIIMHAAKNYRGRPQFAVSSPQDILHSGYAGTGKGKFGSICVKNSGKSARTGVQYSVFFIFDDKHHVILFHLEISERWWHRFWNREKTKIKEETWKWNETRPHRCYIMDGIALNTWTWGVRKRYTRHCNGHYMGQKKDRPVQLAENNPPSPIIWIERYWDQCTFCCIIMQFDWREIVFIQTGIVCTIRKIGNSLL